MDEKQDSVTVFEVGGPEEFVEGQSRVPLTCL